jgi:hypothetical protein
MDDPAKNVGLNEWAAYVYLVERPDNKLKQELMTFSEKQKVKFQKIDVEAATLEAEELGEEPVLCKDMTLKFSVFSYPTRQFTGDVSLAMDTIWYE